MAIGKQNHSRGTSKRRGLGTWGCLLLSFAAGVGACTGSDGSATRTVGKTDNPSNGIVQVDEANLTATVAGGELRLDIPVTPLRNTANGELKVSMISVDGTKTLETVSVSYDVNAAQTLHTTLRVPADIAGQADWVKYSVLITDDASTELRVTSSALRVVKPYEVRLEGPATVSSNKTVTYRVRAQQPMTLSPLGGVPVELDLTNGDKTVKTLTATTTDTGDAVFDVAVTDTGSYSLAAKTSQQGTTAVVSGAVTVAAPDQKVLLTTDKPIYQPGQTIHLRTLALEPPDNTPIAKQTATFEVEDGKGNKVFHEDVSTDAYGVASDDFVIGNVVNEGTYKTRVAVAGVVTEKTVNVSHYVLPKFNVSVSVDHPYYTAGQTVTGTLDAEYFFGKPVANADVKIDGYTLDIGQTAFQEVVGKTDANGKMTFNVTLPSTLAGLPLEQGNAVATLQVTITDTAGQVLTKDTTVTVAQNAASLTVVPESTTLVAGLENRLQIFALDPLGAPVANAKVKLGIGTTSLDLQTDAFGHAEARVTPDADTTTVTAALTPPGGTTISRTFTFGEQAGQEHVIVRTDKSVYDVGDTVTVQVIGSKSEAHVYVDWLNEGQAVDMKTLDLTDGSATYTATLDASLLGSNRVEAYIVDDGGNVVRAGRTLFVRGSSSLDVTVTADKDSYTPGASASLTFSVKDESGKPAVAALGVQIVDEAVYSLVDAQPGLLKSYFELEDAYSTPTYELDAPPGSLSALLFDKTRSTDQNANAAAQAQTEATLAAIGGSMVTGIEAGSFAKVITDATTDLAPYFATLKTKLTPVLTAIAKLEMQTLESQGCSAQSYYCSSLNTDFMTALIRRIGNDLLASDFWGNAFTTSSTGSYPISLVLTSDGPDEKPGTADDQTMTFVVTDLGIPSASFSVPELGAAEPPEAAANGAAGAGGTTSATTAPAGNGTMTSQPRVRSDFPETLYVNPEIITGSDGTAKVSLDVADSITTFRVTTLANSAAGKLGGGLGSLKVFQDFFVDVAFPSTLTRGDEVQVPITVYSYLTTSQTVHLTFDAGSWYTPLGATSMDVPVDPGQVLGVRFPLRVEQVGQQTLTVHATTGSTASDAVARTVSVVPDGKAFPETHSAALGAGTRTENVTFPPNAVPGSQKLYVNVYPTFLSQVVQGMDSIFSVPNGCFEQTTSTTWPNVLALTYMKQTNQVTPDVELKAESYINAGYQRLLTFEHPGGGFSWFGTQDPAPYLSVTALGVMEFADMAKVHPVDSAMIDRTKTWLIGQQQSDGSWPGDKSEFFDIETSASRNTAFVLWALANAGDTGPELSRGIAYLKTQMTKGAPDGYTLGLVANAFQVAAPSDPMAADLLSQLDGMKQTDGSKVSWDSAGTETSFYGAGNDAAVTTTAMVAYAMLLGGGYTDDVQGALEYLAASKDPNGNFGSTQATVMALRTLVLAATKGTDVASGSLAVSVDGTPFTTLTLGKNDAVMTTVDLTKYAVSGAHAVELDFSGKGQLSYSMVDSYNLPWSAVPPDTAPLSVTVTYDKTSLHLNDTALATVNVTNTQTQTANMLLVTVGVPPGFSVKTDDLDAYKASGALSQYELTERQLTLYVNQLAAAGMTTFSYHLVATMPVTAVDGGAQAFLYYDPTKKGAAAPQTFTVTDG
ncbi:MAG TPA: MG2 domain-containing protein [Polyangiaceae bacterium]|nr:MG2 domain-containing protein [Polyangiaceae bacterium]